MASAVENSNRDEESALTPEELNSINKKRHQTRRSPLAGWEGDDPENILENLKIHVANLPRPPGTGIMGG